MEKNRGEIKMGAIIQIILYILLTVSALFLMKSGELAISFNGGQLNINASLTNIIGMTFYICSFLLWMLIIQKYDLSYIYPVATGMVYILIFIGGVIIFKEQVAIKEIVAVLFILTGIVLINLK